MMLRRSLWVSSTRNCWKVSAGLREVGGVDGEAETCKQGWKRRDTAAGEPYLPPPPFPPVSEQGGESCGVLAAEAQFTFASAQVATPAEVPGPASASFQSAGGSRGLPHGIDSCRCCGVSGVYTVKIGIDGDLIAIRTARFGVQRIRAAAFAQSVDGEVVVLRRISCIRRSMPSAFSDACSRIGRRRWP